MSEQRLRYIAESGGFTVLNGTEFIGRVKRCRETYHHSNGRTYRAWVWYAWSMTRPVSAMSHRTRSAAGQYLKQNWASASPKPPGAT